MTTGAGQGQRQESLHPNHYGQLALGTCLGLHLTGTPTNHRCTNTPGEGPRAMRLGPASTN
ncbi:hypothetical protein [Streptomyces sp. NPDC047070]|uniref:hypothetical protein n=1 Tax=Streptomyces sp. NPDC047070 TaxID=3154923 RepID=UPI0034531FAB